ncbi:MAG TPA: hypothetical protein VGE60_05505 [Telluria sp.]
MSLLWKLALLAVAGMAAGCAPLQQAPLVYSSKVSVGVDVSATSTETPGVGVNVGYKQIDAAYVPVAVSRKCEHQNATACTDKTYDIVALNGDSSDEAGDDATPAQLALKAQLMAQAAGKVNQSQNRLAEATLRYNQDKALSEKLEESTQALAHLKANSGDADAIGAAQSARDNAAAAQSRLVSRQNELIAARQAMDEAAKENIAASEGYKNLSPLNRNGKRDAFSVFGSFEGNTKVSGDLNKAGANIGLGKVFSTGVASQNLTQGMASYFGKVMSSELENGGASSAARNSPAVSCIGKAQELIAGLPVADRKDVAIAALNACGGGLPATLSSLP